MRKGKSNSNGYDLNGRAVQPSTILPSGACRACRLRKVKCDRLQPCSQCAHLELVCDFSHVAAKRKPPIRGRLVAKARENDSLPPPPLWSSGSLDDENTHGGSSQPRWRGIPEADGNNYTDEFFVVLIPDFERLVYPVNPIISPDEIRAAIASRHANCEDAALVYAFAAATKFLTSTPPAMHDGVVAQMNDLIQRSLESHRRADLGEGEGGGLMLEELPVTVKRVITCILLEVSMMAFKRFDRSFALLREAITLLETLKIRQSTSGKLHLEGHETPRCQRLYWEAYIHERFLTIAAGYPSILPSLRSGVPLPDFSIPPHINLGFNRLIHLFLIIDGPFLEHWVAQQDSMEAPSEMSTEWIETKLAQLDQDEVNAADAEAALVASGQSGLTELQQADLFVTRLWMRTLVWQLALSHGLLSSELPKDTHEGLSLGFPAQRLSDQLRILIARLTSVVSIGAQGTGILQKLFEITSTIADVMALYATHGDIQEDSRMRTEEFAVVVQVLFTFDRIREEQRDYLREKLDTLRQLYSNIGTANRLNNY